MTNEQIAAKAVSDARIEGYNAGVKHAVETMGCLAYLNPESVTKQWIVLEIERRLKKAKELIKT